MTGATVASRAAMIRSGQVPPLADGFTVRPESVAGLAGLVPGTAVALVPAVPGQPAASCGKTQLAAWHAQELCRTGQVSMMFWVDASSRSAALSGYVQAAEATGTRTSGPAEQAAARLAGWLADTTAPWLMVLDDLSDLADLDGIWPAGPAGQVLITAPGEHAFRQEHRELPGQVIPVGGFSPREAMSYLTGRLAGESDQRHGAIDLAIAMDGDPLALAQASAVIATADESCRDYLARYTAARDRLAACHLDDVPPGPAAVTWILAANRAAQLLPDGTTWLLLTLAAMLDGTPLPGPLLSAPATRGWLGEQAGPEPAWEAARVLEGCGLVSIDPPPASATVRMSRLVAALVRASQPEQILHRAARAAADALVQIWPQPDAEPGQAAALRSCADAVHRTAPEVLYATGTCHPVLTIAGRSLDAARLTGPAVRHWTQLVTVSSRACGPGNQHTQAAATGLARALLAAGQPAKAAEWWQRIAAHAARRSGPDHPGALAAQVELGRATTAAGKPSRAVTLLEQAVAALERACGPGHPCTIGARDAHAAAYLAAGRTAQAISCYQANLTETEIRHGPRHPAALTARDRLAAAYLAAGKPGDAITCYQSALASRTHLFGADHTDTNATRRDLATACQAAGKIAAALKLHDQARVSYQRTLGAAHPLTLACAADLADAYYHAGHLADAVGLLRDIVDLCDQALPPGHHLTATVRQAITTMTRG